MSTTIDKPKPTTDRIEDIIRDFCEEKGWFNRENRWYNFNDLWRLAAHLRERFAP